MIVVDASVVVEALLGTSSSARARDVVFDPDETLHAPHLIDLELAQVLRRYSLKGLLSDDRAAQVLEDYLDLPIERFSHELLLQRIWELRRNLTSYDAAYVALAELLDAPLLTCDKGLAAAPGIRARVELIGK